MGVYPRTNVGNQIIVVASVRIPWFVEQYELAEEKVAVVVINLKQLSPEPLQPEGQAEHVEGFSK